MVNSFLGLCASSRIYGTGRFAKREFGRPRLAKICRVGAIERIEMDAPHLVLEQVNAWLGSVMDADPRHPFCVSQPNSNSLANTARA